MLWGGVFVAAKLAMTEIPPQIFAVQRIGVASLVLLLSWIGFRGFAMRGFPWRILIWAGLAQTAFQAMFMQSIHLTTAGLSAILLATSPLLSAAWLGARAQERVTPMQWVGLLIGFAGVALVMGGAIGDASGTLLGNVLALGAGAAWAWYGVAIAPLVQRVGAVRAASASLLVAGGMLSPIALVGLSGVTWESVSGGAWAGLGYSGILGLAVPTALWVRSVGRYGTQATMNYGYIEPVAAVTAAAIVLHEAVGPIQALGSVLALAGVFLATGHAVSREAQVAAQLRD